MSYYDDASLMFLAGGGAQKDGTAYSVKPVPVYGAELITNGDFATDSDWTKQTGWTISGGKAIVTNAPNLYQRLTQSSLSFNLNSTYKISITCSEYSSGFVYLRKPRGAEPDTNLRIDSVGTFVFTLNALTELNEFALAIGALGTDLKIDNISVKEVLVGDGDFTFSRGSNLAATRVGADGLIEKGRENVLLQSNQFDTTWTELSQGTITSGQAGYDGTNDAWLLTAGAVFSRVQQSISQSDVKTFSVYAKSGTQGGIFLRLNGGSNPRCFFDLNNGQVGNPAGDNIDASIESVGNGWYRCSLIANNTADSAQIYIADDNNGFVSSGNIYIQDAQLELGLAATEYIETTTTTGTAGILEDTPRFDYSNGASCPSLLLEPSATQLFPQSEYFDGSDWTKYGGASLTNNNSVSPDGLQNATKLTNVGGIYDQIAYTPNTDYTYSLFAKTDGATSIIIGFVDQAAGYLGGKIRYTFATNVASVILQSANGSVTADREDYGNGWIRVIIKFKTNVAQNYNYQFIEFDGGDGWIYGANLIQSSYPTSYIPNHSGGTITRAADVCGGAGDANTFNSTEGVLYVEIAALADLTSQRWISIGSGSNANRVSILFNATSKISCSVRGSSAAIYDASANIGAQTNNTKAAIKYKNSDFSFFVNGLKVDSQQSGSISFNAPLSELAFDSADGASDFYGKVKQVLTFNTALSDADLAALTTI